MLAFECEYIYFRDKIYKWKFGTCRDCCFHGKSQIYTFDCIVRKFGFPYACSKPGAKIGIYEISG